MTLMCHLFNVYGLIHHFQLDMVKLHRFLGKLQERVSDYGKAALFVRHMSYTGSVQSALQSNKNPVKVKGLQLKSATVQKNYAKAKDLKVK